MMSDISAKVQSELPSHPHYMRPLDGIRAMACMLVIASHIAKIGDLTFRPEAALIGAVGVVIFFVLSGFLMTTLYVDKKFNFDTAVKYMIARLSRIAPSYWIAITFAWLIYFFLLPDFHYQMTPFNMVRSFFLAGNQGVFWSIPPEVQFYVFFLLLWVAYFNFKNGKLLLLILSVLICAGFVATRESWGGLMLPSKLHIFLFGFMGAFILRYDRMKSVICHPVFQTLSALAAFAYCILFVRGDDVYADKIFPLLVGISIASFSVSTKITYLFETATMRLIGAASFSIYLFHDPILFALLDFGVFDHMNKMLMIALTSFISLAIPIAFHFLAEKRLNQFTKAKALEVFEISKAYWPVNRFGSR